MTTTCQWSPELHLNAHLEGLSPSATIAIQQLCRQLTAQGRDIFRLGLGQSPFPVPELVVRALQENAHQKDYLPVKGLPELRQAILDHHRPIVTDGYSIENIVIGPGSKELMFLLQLVYDGEIMIPMPAWVSYLPQARIVGRQITTLQTSYRDGWKITADQLDSICRRAPGRARLLIMNYPSNPTGQTYNLTELTALAEVFRQHRILVLADEIYGRLNFAGSHVSLLNLYPDGTILSSGLSKWCGAGGWRLGFFMLPECTGWLSDALATVASETYTSTSAPIQFAAIAAYKPRPELDTYLLRCRSILQHLAEAIMVILSQGDIGVLAPQGGFYLFPDFEAYRTPLARRGIATSKDLCRQLLADTGVAILPGSDFGRDETELTARLAFVDFDGSKALADYPQDERPSSAFINAACGRTIEAVSRLVDWLNRL